jgi:hypothetical protein
MAETAVRSALRNAGDSPLSAKRAETSLSAGRGHAECPRPARRRRQCTNRNCDRKYRAPIGISFAFRSLLEIPM